jgi:hypothetical protein
MALDDIASKVLALALAHTHVHVHFHSFGNRGAKVDVGVAEGEGVAAVREVREVRDAVPTQSAASRARIKTLCPEITKCQCLLLRRPVAPSAGDAKPRAPLPMQGSLSTSALRDSQHVLL